MGTYARPPVGFNFCLVGQCSNCEGTGWRKPSFCAANDMGGQLHTEKFFGSGAPPPSEPCVDCLKGFRFAPLEMRELLPFLLEQVRTDPRIAKLFMEAVIHATEQKMVPLP